MQCSITPPRAYIDYLTASVKMLDLDENDVGVRRETNQLTSRALLIRLNWQTRVMEHSYLDESLQVTS